MVSRQNPTFFCRQCRLPFQRRIDLVRHRRIHLGACRFTCHVCRKTFSRRDSLKCHALVHPCRIKESPSLPHGSDYTAKTILRVYAELSQEPLFKSILKRARGNFAACERAPIETEKRIARSTLASACQLSSQSNAKTNNAASFNFRSRRPQTPKRNSEVISHQLFAKIKVLSPSAKRNIRTTKSSLQGYVKNSSAHRESADHATTAAPHNESPEPLTTANREMNKMKGTGRQGPLRRPLQMPYVRLIRHSFSSPEEIRDFVKRECALGKGSSLHRETSPLSKPLDQGTSETGVKKKCSLSRPIQQPFVRLIRHSLSSPEEIRDFVQRECALGKGNSFHRKTTPLSMPLAQDTSKTRIKKKCSLSRPIQQPFVRLIRHSFSSPEEIRDFVKRECALGKGISFHRETTPLSTPLDQDTSETGVKKKCSLSRPIQQPIVRLTRHSFSSPEEIRDFVKRECALGKGSSSHREATSLSTPLDQSTSEIGVTNKRSLNCPIQQPFVRLLRHSFSSPEEIRKARMCLSEEQFMT